MKKMIYILLIISAANLSTLETVNVRELVKPIDNRSIQNLQTNSQENFINHNGGGVIRFYNLNNLFINKDLFAISERNTEFQNRSGREITLPSIWIEVSILVEGGEDKMVKFPKMSNSELKKRRIEYYAAKRRVDSLENKVVNISKIIETGKRQRVKVDKVTRDKAIEIVKLTNAQIKDVNSKLVATEFQLLVAKDELKQKDFGFSQATGAITEKFVSSKQAYIQKKANEKVEDVKALVNSAVMNGGLQTVLDVQNLTANSGDFKQIKSELMKIVRKENKNGYPIKNVSFKTVEVIMAGLLNWDTKKSDQPFDIS